MHFEDFSYFSKHSIQINVWKKNYARWTNFMNVKMGFYKEWISGTFRTCQKRKRKKSGTFQEFIDVFSERE
jgi:vacuolar-type H+-ATPase subunit C/Vma6